MQEVGLFYSQNFILPLCVNEEGNCNHNSEEGKNIFVNQSSVNDKINMTSKFKLSVFMQNYVNDNIVLQFCIKNLS